MANGWMDGNRAVNELPAMIGVWLELATTGNIKGFDIDTNFFLGNHPPHASIEGCLSTTDRYSITEWDNANISWKEILPKSPLMQAVKIL